MLLLHINYYMFLPQGSETDVYDANGQQVDDCNSVVEWVGIALGYDKTPDDEDDDDGNNFVLTKACDIYFHQQQFIIISPLEIPAGESKTFFPLHKEPILLQPFAEVATPPPDLTV